jgi:DnaJ family protein C protein 17
MFIPVALPGLGLTASFPPPTQTSNRPPQPQEDKTPKRSLPTAEINLEMDAELVAWARDAASKGDDLFTLLAIDATASESDIRRAFRRKALQLHPDKAGDAYDPALYERIERARDALINPEARKAYDDGMRAVLQKRAQLDQMSARRRRLVEELEQREEAAKRAKTETGRAQPDPERDAMLARGRAKAEERRRLMREAEERERETVAREEKEKEKEAPATATEGAAADDDYDSKIADLERRIEEKRQRKLKKMMAKKGGAGAEDTKLPSPPPLSYLNLSTGTAEADACKQPPADEPAPAEPVQNASGNKFAATMARLKAAQAKRDEEKRRKAETEAKAAS